MLLKPIALLLGIAVCLAADEPAAEKAAAAAPKAAAPKPAAARRMQSAAMRNENVAINPIDNNAVKESNVRVGIIANEVNASRAESRYFAVEMQRPATAAISPASANAVPGWHGDLFAFHQNSVFNARTFFQVGGVKPSRQNQWGARATGTVREGTFLTFNVSQRKVRGMVNGNVLVPLPSERAPRTNDPLLRPLIERFLAAYPDELPNRLDFDERALNTNAPQRIDSVMGDVRLDQHLGRAGKLTAFHSLTRSFTDAFQFVAGQNPDVRIHGHRSQLAWYSAGGPWDVSAGFTFLRTRSALEPEPNAVGPRVRMGYQIQELGPDSEFPVNRSQNSFRYGGVARRLFGSHQVTLGGDVTRWQLNGYETSNSRGFIQYSNNFGRGAIENFLRGTPSNYEISLGETARGFRNWTGDLFFGDQWKVTPQLEFSYGLHYNVVGAPTEVDNLHPTVYPCDCNNFGPRAGIAWKAPKGIVLRAYYLFSYGDVPPVTYGQIRFNEPYVRTFQVQNPSLANPLAGIDVNGPDARVSPVYFEDLKSPYARQYGLSLERRLGGANAPILRGSYIGSRSFQLLNAFVFNRAVPVDGIPLTIDTVDQRRPDPNFTEKFYIVNGGMAYLDAAKLSLDMPARRGLRFSAAYTFSKAIDDGTDFSSTAANRDRLRRRSQSQYENYRDKRGLSDFDSPHALLIDYSYDLPALRHGPRWAGWISNGWQVSGVSLLKSGTPLTLFVGSDAPGFGNVDGGPSDRPNIVDTSILGMTIGHPDTAPQILRRDRFAYITPGEPRGNLGRGTFRKARIANWNAALTRQWIFGGGREWRAQLRGEVYNLTNTPQFDEPQRNYTQPAFGKITNALNDGRVFQLGLRLIL